MAFNIGLKALRSLCAEQNVLAYNRAKLTSKLFKGNEVEVFQWIDTHVAKYHVLPALSTFASAYPEVKEIDTPEPTKYYVELLENQFFYNTINSANLTSQEILKANKDAWEPALDCLKAAQETILLQKYRTKIMDVSAEAPALILNEYHKYNGDEQTKAEFGWHYMDKMGSVVAGDVVSFVGRPATGKAQPLDSKVLTPTGFVTMGSLKVGDKVVSTTGEDSEVTGIYPQGSRPMYQFTFVDGRTAEGSDEHLWEVMYRDWGAPKVLTTMQLVKMLEHKRYQKRLSVQYFSGVWGKTKEFVVHPYLMGVLLGDGCFRATDLRMTSADDFITGKVQSLLNPHGCRLVYQGQYDYTVVSDTFTRNPIKSNLQDAGLWGVKSQGKFIPRDYLTASTEQRWELLQGLMDTDGTAEKTGGCSYCTTSPKLAKQVQELVRGLGGKASIKTKETTGSLAYILHIVINDRARLFSLPRKKARVAHERTTHKTVRLTLESIHYLEDKECQCISVSHPSRLYVTDNYVVTHNTWQMLYTALHNWRMGQNVLFVSMEMSPLPMAQRIVAMYAGTNISQLKSGGYSTHKAPDGSPSMYSKFTAGLKEIHSEKAKLYVVDGNLAASAEDVFALADQLKCKLVFIDGAYLMRHKNTKLDRFTRAAENVELMKRACTDLDQMCFGSWQFNRAAVKDKKKGEKGALEDIGYSDAIGQISSIVLGLFQEEGVETMEKRQIKVLKGRNGEIGQFDVNWDFINMDFSSVDKPLNVAGHETYVAEPLENI